MKLIILVACALVAVAVAAPAQPEPAQVLEYAFDTLVDGGYKLRFMSEDGVERVETGELVEALDEDNKPQKVITVRGSYSYPGPDGKPVVITYEADENGFRAMGDSIPQVPEPARR